MLVGGWGRIQHIFLCPFSFYGLSAFSINLGMVAEGKKPAVPKEREAQTDPREANASEGPHGRETDTEPLSRGRRGVCAGLRIGTICRFLRRTEQPSEP